VLIVKKEKNMSHYTVLVIGENPEKQLEPYYETSDPSHEKTEFSVEIEEGKLEEAYQHKEGVGYGCYSNPDAKWDWYSIGGRWTGFFKVKEGVEAIVGSAGLMTLPAEEGRADQARCCEVDWEGMKEASIKSAENSWEEAKSCEDETERYWKYGIEKDISREEYIRRRSLPTTFAVLKDGEWYERGEMGWWACVKDEKDQSDWEEEFAKLLDSLHEDTLLTLVDCHI
jgi:hypothetical protein